MVRIVYRYARANEAIVLANTCFDSYSNSFAVAITNYNDMNTTIDVYKYSLKS